MAHLCSTMTGTSYGQGRGQEVLKWLQTADTIEPCQVFFSSHSLSMELLCASSQHGSLNRVRFLTWSWLPPELVSQETQEQITNFPMSQLQKSQHVTSGTLYLAKQVTKPISDIRKLELESTVGRIVRPRESEFPHRFKWKRPTKETTELRPVQKLC